MSKGNGSRTEEQAALESDIRTLYLKRRKLELEAEVRELEEDADYEERIPEPISLPDGMDAAKCDRIVLVRGGNSYVYLLSPYAAARILDCRRNLNQKEKEGAV